ncbi:lipopolysaccharide biosynthesis protein [Rhodoferax ferrireducens]|uniref:lipopolysaccharide biosynthesis protein n=1 Tax=Rhodoferax ferrireducens TaxID=192843 RepID=UPI003BB61D20
MSLRSQALSGFRWTASVRLLSQLITWAITIVVVRLLTPTDYGLLSMATVFIGFLQMFSELGLGPALVQKTDLDERTLRQTFGIVLVLNLALAAVLALAAPLIGAFFAEPRVVPVIRVLSLQFVIGGFDVIPNVLLQRRMEFRKRSLLDLTGAIIASVTTLVMAFAGAGVWSLVVGSIAGQTWRVIGINFLAPFLHWPELSMRGMRSLLTFGGHLTLAGLFGTFFSQIDVIICAKVLGNEILGFYSVGIQLASLPSDKIAGLVNQVAFPTFSRMQHDVRKVGESVLLGVRILSFFAFPLLWGISSIAPEIVEVVLGAKWMQAVVPLQVLALIIPFRIIGGFVGVAVQGMGRSDILLRNTIWAALVAPPLLFAGAYADGLRGLSLAWLVLSPSLFLFAMKRSAPVIGLRTRQVFAAMAPAAGAGLTMYGAVIAVRFIIAGYGLGGVLRMGVLIAVGAIAYCAVSFVLNRKGALEVIEMVRSIATSKRVSPMQT